MISPLRASAKRRAISVLPTAVGPASNSSGAFMVWLRERPAAQHEKKNQARRENTRADQVRLRRPAAVQDCIIAAEKFHHRPQHGVAHEVGSEHLAIEFAAREQPG